MLGLKLVSNDEKTIYYIVHKIQHYRVTFNENDNQVRNIEEYSKEDYSKREERSYNDELLERVHEDEIPTEIKNKVRETYS